MTTVFTSLKTLHYLKYPSVFENFYFEKKKNKLYPSGSQLFRICQWTITTIINMSSH